MHQTVIREATAADLETLYRFEQAVITAERPFDTTLAEDPINYYDLEFMIEADHIRLLVAELDGLLIGSGYARIEKADAFLKHKQHAYLGFMYVEPAYRGKGVNQMIVQALKEWSLSRGVSELRLEVYCDNAAAVKAYEKIGFSKLLYTMRMGD